MNRRPPKSKRTYTLFPYTTLFLSPLIPASLLARMADQDGDGLPDYNFSKRLVDVGARGSAVDRDTFRIVTGFKGDLIRDWTYETSVGYGVSKESQISRGQDNELGTASCRERVWQYGSIVLVAIVLKNKA